MAKLRTLSGNTKLDHIKLELPDKALKSFKNYLGGEKDMYYVGSIMGEVFMSPDAPKDKRRLYPFPPEIQPSALLNWEIKNIDT